MRTAIWILATTAFAGAFDAQGAEVKHADYFATAISGNFQSKDWGTDGSGVTASVTYGRLFDRHFGMEVKAFGTVFETGWERATDFYQAGLTLDAVC